MIARLILINKLFLILSIQLTSRTTGAARLKYKQSTRIIRKTMNQLRKIKISPK